MRSLRSASAAGRGPGSSACAGCPTRRCRSSCRRTSVAIASSSVIRLSRLMRAPAVRCSRRLVRAGEVVAELVGDAGQVELEGEALLEPVALLDVPQVDAVEALLGGADDRRRLRRRSGGRPPSRRRAARLRGTTCSTLPKACSSAAVAVAEV